MTGPKPTLVNGRIALQYSESSIGTHACNLDVDITSPTLGGPNTLDLFGGGVLSWTDAVDEFVLKAKPLFDSSVTLTQSILYHFVSGAYQPLESYSVGVAGTGSGGVSTATQETYVFRDAQYNADKIVFFEQGSSVPLHLNYGGLGSSRKAFVDSVLAVTSGNIGRWYLSKSNAPIVSFLAVTTTFNRRLRRIRGQA